LNFKGGIMQELQGKITDWHEKTFTDATQKDIADKICSEMIELTWELKEFTDGEPNLSRIIDECADVFIVISAFLGRNGVDFEMAVRDKMERNKKRRWTTDGTVRLSE